MDEYSQERLTLIAEEQFITNSSDYIFEAADCLRMGQDVFVQHGFTTNERGIAWLKRELKGEFRVHKLNFPNDTCPVHIDATFVPVRIPDSERKGIMWTNPERDLNPALKWMFKDSWDLVEAPRPAHSKGMPRSLCSPWLSMNCLNLNPTTMIIEETEVNVEKSLNSLGITTIKVPFRSCYEMGGSLHCHTTDVRRTGRKMNYFPHLDQSEKIN